MVKFKGAALFVCTESGRCLVHAVRVSGGSRLANIKRHLDRLVISRDMREADMQFKLAIRLAQRA